MVCKDKAKAPTAKSQVTLASSELFSRSRLHVLYAPPFVLHDLETEGHGTWQKTSLH